MKQIKTLLRIIVVILRNNALEQNFVLKQIEGFIIISGNSAATKYDAKLHLIITLCHETVKPV